MKIMLQVVVVLLLVSLLAIGPHSAQASMLDKAKNAIESGVNTGASAVESAIDSAGNSIPKPPGGTTFNSDIGAWVNSIGEALNDAGNVISIVADNSKNFKALQGMQPKPDCYKVPPMADNHAACPNQTANTAYDAWKACLSSCGQYPYANYSGPLGRAFNNESNFWTECADFRNGSFLGCVNGLVPRQANYCDVNACAVKHNQYVNTLRSCAETAAREAKAQIDMKASATKETVQRTATAVQETGRKLAKSSADSATVTANKTTATIRDNAARLGNTVGGMVAVTAADLQRIEAEATAAVNDVLKNLRPDEEDLVVGYRLFIADQELRRGVKKAILDLRDRYGIYVGRPRPLNVTNLPPKNGNPNDNNDPNWSHYEDQSHTIQLTKGRATSDLIETARHELGHAILGHKFVRIISPNGAHNICDANNAGLAMSEGWANFVGLVLSPDPRNYKGFNWEEKLAGPGCPYSIANEFRVAAILWDIFDSTNERGDELNVNFIDMFRVFSPSLQTLFNGPRFASIDEYMARLDANLGKKLGIRLAKIRALNLTP